MCASRHNVTTPQTQHRKQNKTESDWTPFCFVFGGQNDNLFCLIKQFFLEHCAKCMVYRKMILLNLISFGFGSFNTNVCKRRKSTLIFSGETTDIPIWEAPIRPQLFQAKEILPARQSSTIIGL